MSRRYFITECNSTEAVQVLAAHVRPKHELRIAVGAVPGLGPKCRVVQKSQSCFGEGIALRAVDGRKYNTHRGACARGAIESNLKASLDYIFTHLRSRTSKHRIFEGNLV